jgi:hypothetical protein
MASTCHSITQFVLDNFTPVVRRGVISTSIAPAVVKFIVAIDEP